jgi:uncharacterized protein (DUF1697 family)
MIHVALLYSIGLPQGRLVMNDLRELALHLGFRAPRTIFATGNLVFEADEDDPGLVERQLETAYAARFGRHVDIIVRDGPHWARTVAANPFREAEGTRVMVRVQREPLPPETIERLEPYRSDGDIVRIVDGDVWVCFGRPPNESRLIGALTPRRLGIGTSRIWNTVRRLGEMVNSDAP